MKRKIALLLTFTMLLSVLPLNVFASDTSASISGQPTGAMWERTLGRATNVRHWNPGVLVATASNVTRFRSAGLTPNDAINWDRKDGSDRMGDPIVAESSGNLRHILASMEYFSGTAHNDQYVASITMTLNNAQGFMRSLFNGRPVGNAYGGSGRISYDEDHGFRAPPALTGEPTLIVGQGEEIRNLFYDLLATVVEVNAGGPTTRGAISAAQPRVTVNFPSGPAMEVPDFNGNNWLPRMTVSAQFNTAVALREALATIESADYEITRIMNLSPADRMLPNNVVALQEAFRDVYLATMALNNINGINIDNPWISNVNAIDRAMVEAFLAFYEANPPTFTGNNGTLAPGRTDILTGTRWIVFPRSPDLERAGGWFQNVGDASSNNLPNIDATRSLLSIIVDIGNIYEGLRLQSERATFAAQLDNILAQDEATDSPATTVIREPLMMLYQEAGPGVNRNDFIVAVMPRYNTRVSIPASGGAAYYQDTNMIRNQVDLVMIRTNLDRQLVTGSGIPVIAVPIEYVTDNDTNRNPVSLTFTHRHLWPQAGESGSTTHLTAISDSRFTLSLHDVGDRTDDVATPRTFHRYGRGVIPGIRISEAVQSAFDRSDWWVEIELITPGFYWTEGSIYGRSGSNSSRFDNRFQTRFQMNNQNAQQEANDIRPVRTQQVVQRAPVTGNNRFNTLRFPVDLEGVANNPQRQVNDWLQIEELTIGATDRARNGDVVAEVRLYRRDNIVTDAGTIASGTWSWHPWPLANLDDGTLAGSVGSAAWPSGPPQRLYPNFVPSQVGDQNTVRFLNRANNIDSLSVTSSANTVGEFRWNQPIQGGTSEWGRGSGVFDQQIVVARFGTIGLELFVHENDDVENHQLRSGARDWEFVRTPPPGETRPVGAVLPQESDFTQHTTVRTVLRETAPGSLPATGAHPTVFTFGEGIQILGVKLWANDAHFSAGHNDSDASVYFGEARIESDNFLNATIERNTVTIRPEIGENANRRYNLAEITAEFYISVQAGYESLYGENIDVTVTSGTVDLPFEESLTVAYAWDPITVDTTNIVLDENDIEAAFGVVRGVDISDITLTETRSGEIFAGQRIWLGIEGGISRGWGSGDHAALRAASVETTGGLQVSPIQNDSHGIFVEVMRGSNVDGAQLIFSGVQVTGRVVPDHQYNIIVADTAVAHNWEGMGWVNATQSDVGFTRGLVRGFFNEEPYITPAFRFEGDGEFYAPIELPPGTVIGGGPEGVMPTVPPATPGPTIPIQPVQLTEGMAGFNSVRVPGTMIEGTPLIIEANPLAPGFATSFVMLAVIADLVGIEGVWDGAARTGTFSDNHNNTLVVTEGSTTATFNGQPRQITASGVPAQAIIRNDRFYVPVGFFREIPEWAISVVWTDQSALGGSRFVTVQPRISDMQ